MQTVKFIVLFLIFCVLFVVSICVTVFAVIIFVKKTEKQKNDKRSSN